MSLNLRYIGFCGADDSVHPGLLQLLSSQYPTIEWGFLFRPDMEGKSRYISKDHLENLNEIRKKSEISGVVMNLAGHLCGSRCEEVLTGNYDFVRLLISYGFKRIQINATRANNVNIDLSKSNEYARSIRAGMQSTKHELEWIIQANDETKHVWEQLLVEPESNMSILFDASCGLGKQITEYPTPYPSIPCGYAGGIGPNNVCDVLASVQAVTGSKAVWIDMESSLRLTVSDKFVKDLDVFSIEKCYECVIKCADFLCQTI